MRSQSITRLLSGVVTSLAITLAAGCAAKGDHSADQAANDLVITTAGPAAIDARFQQGDHTVVLQSKQVDGAIKSEILDEHGHSMTKLAMSITARSKQPGGTTPVAALLQNAAQLQTTIRLTEVGLRQLRDAIGKPGVEAALFVDLSQQPTLLHKGLIQTRLALLEVWGSEARRHIAMTTEEHAKFFAILGREGAFIAGTSTVTATSLASEIEALLGPKRYADYTQQRKAFLAPMGVAASSEVVL